ncbi:MAG: glycosyltransferase family 2 protein [Candidatus Acidiferrales bacterium]
MSHLSVIIVSYNVREYLRECLQSVFGRTDGLTVEVWVVDNASRDGSTAMVQTEFPQVRLITNRANLGFARAANQVLREAKGDYVLLLNPDARLLDNSLAALVNFLEQKSEVGVVGGAVFNPDCSLDPACHRGLPTPLAMAAKALGLDRLMPSNRTLAQCNMLWLPPDQEAEVISVSGGFLMTRRKVLESIGLLDERFFLYYEDSDFCDRAREAGWKVIFYPEAKVVHHKGASSRNNPRLARLVFCRSYLAYYDKHLARGRLKRWLVHFLVCLYSGFDPRLKATPGEITQLFQDSGGAA